MRKFGSRKGASLVEIMIVVAILLIAGAVCSGSCSNRSSQGSYTPGVRTEVTGQATTLMNADAFDLATVTALIKDGKVENVEALEAKVNDASSGINNVDLNGDGKVDYVGIVETQNSDGSYTLDFQADPKGSDWTDGAMTIATVTVNQTTQEVAGAYPSYVNGYRDYYYRYDHVSFADAMFYSWLFMPTRPVYMYHYPSYGYSSYGVMPASTLSTTRTSYRTTAGVTTVSPTKQPASYKQSASATKTSSAVSAKAKSTSGASSYTPTSSSASKTKGSSSWGSKPSSSTSRPASKPSSSRPASRKR